MTLSIDIHVWYETAVFILQQLDEKEGEKVTGRRKNFSAGKESMIE